MPSSGATSKPQKMILEIPTLLKLLYSTYFTQPTLLNLLYLTYSKHNLMRQSDDLELNQIFDYKPILIWFSLIKKPKSIKWPKPKPII